MFGFKIKGAKLGLIIKKVEAFVLVSESVAIAFQGRNQLPTCNIIAIFPIIAKVSAGFIGSVSHFRTTNLASVNPKQY